MPTPPDPRKKPTSVRIHVSNGAGVDVTWADGHASHYEFAYLREECPCATCKDAREKKASLGEPPSALKQAPALPRFKPKPPAHASTQQANYPLQITSTDGSSTGIHIYY